VASRGRCKWRHGLEVGVSYARPVLGREAQVVGQRLPVVEQGSAVVFTRARAVPLREPGRASGTSARRW